MQKKLNSQNSHNSCNAYLFETSNFEYLKNLIQKELCIAASNQDIRCVMNHPIVLWHSQGNKVNLKIRSKNNLETERSVLDAIGLTFTGIGWPRLDSDSDLKLLFNKKINKVIKSNDNCE